MSGQCNIWIRIYTQQPSYGRPGDLHNQPIGAAEWDGRRAGTNVPEGEFLMMIIIHCSKEVVLFIRALCV